MDPHTSPTPEPATSSAASDNDRHAEFLALFLASEKEVFRYISVLVPSIILCCMVLQLIRAPSRRRIDTRPRSPKREITDNPTRESRPTIAQPPGKLAGRTFVVTIRGPIQRGGRSYTPTIHRPYEDRIRPPTIAGRAGTELEPISWKRPVDQLRWQHDIRLLLFQGIDTGFSLGRSVQRLEDDILELHLHGRPRMHLQRDDALGGG